MEELPEPGDRYFEAVLQVINDSIDRMVKSQEERHFYESLLAGGNHTAANVITYCEAMKNIYGEGSASKSLELTKLFTLLMLVQSYRWLSEHNTQTDESEDSAKAAAANVLALFGDDEDRNIELFLKMKTQFDYDSDHHTSMVHMGGLMLGWAAEAMGQKCVDWENTKFPVKSMSTLTHSGAVLDSSPMRSPGDIKALWACHGLGCKVMMEHYEGKKADSNASANNPESA
ncbi:MAG: hypothetical protein RBR99_00950 [Dehalococcoidales bacterium]|jgi:hypothetical protein|nr:hypothetical protein [Dehalococcoidales bacterium]MDX9986018.1 hypothetical protein [Dehalococcoidales bacterium]NLE90481.1 hypothetical protein [Dehalococcoidales bacterium]